MPKMSFTLMYDGRQVLHVEGDANSEGHAVKATLEALIYSVKRAAEGHPAGTVILDDDTKTYTELGPAERNKA